MGVMLLVRVPLRPCHVAAPPWIKSRAGPSSSTVEGEEIEQDNALKSRRRIVGVCS